MPSNIIKDGAVVSDDWQVLRPEMPDAKAMAKGAEPEMPEVPAGKVLVPLFVWQAKKEELKARGDVAVWLASDQAPAALADDLDALPLIAVDFPAFADGRGFSYARELREQMGYQGEVRAIGAFMRDQLFMLQRCGCNSFALEGFDLEDALNSLKDFDTNYQQDTQEPTPLFRRRA